MFGLIAFILFVIAAVLCFFASDVGLRTIIGVVSAGLAALSLAGVPLSEWRQKLS